MTPALVLGLQEDALLSVSLGSSICVCVVCLGVGGVCTHQSMHVGLKGVSFLLLARGSWVKNVSIRLGFKHSHPLSHPDYAPRLQSFRVTIISALFRPTV